MIAVVGGGITGLVLGWELSRRQVDFVVLEASDRPGGVIRSARVEDRVLEWGPQRTRLTSGLRDLVEDLELEGEALIAPSGLGLFVYRKKRLRRVPFSAGDFLRSDIVSPMAKLRLALEPLTSGADPGERVARYFTRKVGREIYETLVAPLYGGLYGSDPADMVVGLSLGHVLTRVRYSPESRASSVAARRAHRAPAGPVVPGGHADPAERPRAISG